MKTGVFFSLKWKIAVLIASVFLLSYSFFSYLFYLDANDNFLRSRQNIQKRYKNIASALTKDSFSVLEQFAEVLSAVEISKQVDSQYIAEVNSVLDENWQQWQFIWGLENAVFFNKKAEPLKQWGVELDSPHLLVKQVLTTELPAYQTICLDTCFQFVVIPVMNQSKVIGAFGISRSFADLVIEYKMATGSDLGLFVKDEALQANRWPYKISVLTNAEYNLALLSAITQDNSLDPFSETRVVSYKKRFLEISTFPVHSSEEDNPPFFISIDEITAEKNAVFTNLKTVWLYGILSFLFSLTLLTLTLFFSFRRVDKFTTALPLLAEKKYREFRTELEYNTNAMLGYDELDLLNYTALELTDQLEGLEQEVKQNIFQLVEQGENLRNERNFIQQLINVAPILIFTQDTNGSILSINQAGISELERERSLILGDIFDNFIPETEVKHLSQLKQLRAGKVLNNIKIDGVLITPSIEEHTVSWIHSVVKSDNDNKPLVILSLAVDISERKKIENQMVQIATHDQLTGLSNRHNFQLEYSRAIATAKRYGSELALFYLDLDHFKIVNDTQGHEAGDKLLKLVAKTLQRVIRETDILSRIGGDEFTLIMPNSDLQGIMNVAIKINENLKALNFSAGGQHFKISCSIGIAIYPKHGGDEQTLLSNADSAMYQAKKLGKGRYCIFGKKV